MGSQNFDLEERLLEYSVRIIKLVEQLPHTKTGGHIGGQLLRSGTSPYANHGEAQAAESSKDFIHKMSISLKEANETEYWLLLLKEGEYMEANKMDSLSKDIDELIRLLVSIIKTMKGKVK